jgi:hypothetical protein
MVRIEENRATPLPVSIDPGKSRCHAEVMKRTVSPLSDGGGSEASLAQPHIPVELVSMIWAEMA